MESQEIIFIVVAFSLIAFLCKFLFFKKKIDVTLEVDNCEKCPFKYNKKDMIHFSCKLQDIMLQPLQQEDIHYGNLDAMKMNCPVEGKLDIVIKERKDK